MNKGKTVFAQIMSLVNEYEFKKCVDRDKYDRLATRKVGTAAGVLLMRRLLRIYNLPLLSMNGILIL